MKRDSNNRNGTRYEFWRCCSREVCDAPVTIGLPILDEYVREYVIGYMMRHVEKADPRLLIPAPKPATADNGELESVLQAAEDELSAYVSTVSVTDVGAETFKLGLATREEAVQHAREALAEAVPPVTSDVFEGFEVPPELEDEMRVLSEGLELRGESIAESFRLFPDQGKRIVYGNVIDSITISRGRGPVEQRATIKLAV
jgi:hypothetical protein